MTAALFRCPVCLRESTEELPPLWMDDYWPICCAPLELIEPIQAAFIAEREPYGPM